MKPTQAVLLLAGMAYVSSGLAQSTGAVLLPIMLPPPGRLIRVRTQQIQVRLPCKLRTRSLAAYQQDRSRPVC